MRRVSHLIREVDRLANERRWSSTQLATELGVNRTLLAHIRAGRKPLTLPVLARIAQVFGGKPLVRDLLFLHLAVEVPDEAASRLAAPSLAACALPDAVARAVRGYIASFPLAHVAGRSLLLQGEADVLARAAGVLRDAFTTNDVGVMMLVASTPLRASDEVAARRVPALIVERIEFASPSVCGVLGARIAFGLPLILTTTATVDALPAEIAAALRHSAQLITAVVPCPT
jgi:transcriptional regulator with XRE-family HTH domain